MSNNNKKDVLTKAIHGYVKMSPILSAIRYTHRSILQSINIHTYIFSE